MRLVTVMLKNGTRISLKAKDWAGNANFVSISGEDGKHVGTFPTEAIYGLWFSDAQDAVWVTLSNEGNTKAS